MFEGCFLGGSSIRRRLVWNITPAFAVALERSGKAIRQHAFVRQFIKCYFAHLYSFVVFCNDPQLS